MLTWISFFHRTNTHSALEIAKTASLNRYRFANGERIWAVPLRAVPDESWPEDVPLKLYHKLILLALVAMLALPMFMVKPNGERMMSWKDWLPDSKVLGNAADKLRTVAASNPDLSDTPSLKGSSKMYSWKDERGVMHFSEQPPPESIQNAKVRDLPKDVNLMAAVKPRERDGESGSAASNGGQGKGFNLAFPTTVPVKDIPKLVDDAKQLQALADQRTAALKEL